MTESVTGAWFGPVGPMEEFRFELRQEGARVTGTFRTSGRWASFMATSGSVEGVVNGDVFTFKDDRGTFRGEVTISGHEMKGGMIAWKPFPVNLRRIDTSTNLGSPSPPR